MSVGAPDDDRTSFGDEQSPRHRLSTETVYQGRIWDVVSDRFTLAVGARR